MISVNQAKNLTQPFLNDEHNSSHSDQNDSVDHGYG